MKIFGATATLRSMQSRRKSGTQEVMCYRSGRLSQGCKCCDTHALVCFGDRTIFPELFGIRAFCSFLEYWSCVHAQLRWKASLSTVCASTLLSSRVSRSQRCCFSSEQLLEPITSLELVVQTLPKNLPVSTSTNTTGCVSAFCSAKNSRIPH